MLTFGNSEEKSGKSINNVKIQFSDKKKNCIF